MRFWLSLCCGLLLCTGSALTAQDRKVMMLSDLHFDPMHDPAKAERLAAAPVEQWNTILAEPDSTLQKERFAALQLECRARGIDPDATLLHASLDAAKAQAADAVFVTVTGDLLVHDLGCRYNKLLKDRAGYAAFAAKTAVFVMMTVEAAFPEIPVYIAGGNNDSSCGDYRLDAADKYLAATSSAEMAGLHNAAAQKSALATYERSGDFSVMVPGLRRTRLLVLDDIFLAANYANCSGKPSRVEADQELAWLGRELDEVKARGEQAWVIGHIPPGVNVYATLATAADVCVSGQVKMMLSSDGLAETLVKHADVVRVAIFAHTHFDEVRLLGGKVPVKLVASVSAINGNRPSFTVAEVDAKTAVLQDYSVFEASNTTGIHTTWSREYDYQTAYGERDFSAASVGHLASELHEDSGGAKPLSRAYETYFAPGMLPVIALVWPKYACAISNTTEESYKSCSCAGK